jgi:uncharacterized phiE125 gp8 family phage protein
MQVITQPSIEPITLAQAKAWLRVDYDEDDDLIGTLITAARLKAEHYTNRAFITQTLRDVFTPQTLLRPSIGDFLSVVSVEVGGEALTDSDYSETEDELSKAVLLSSAPASAPALTYTAGYGPAAEDVPKVIHQAILLTIAEMYENRTDKVQRLPTASTNLLNTQRRWVT